MLALTTQRLRQAGLSVFVVTSQRHSLEPITINDKSVSLIDLLKEHAIEFAISKEIATDSNVIHGITSNTLGISFGAAWIFKKPFIDLFKGRLLNCHGARLPQDRGAGGFSWRILRNERVGVSLIHQIDPGIDTGNVILFEEYIYPNWCRLPIEYQAYSTQQNEKLLDQFFDLIKAEKSFVSISQQEYFSSYWPRLATDVHGYIDWNWDLKDIERFICAFDDPYKGASTFVNGDKVRLKKCCSSSHDGLFHPFQKGFIYRISRSTIFVATDQGSLLVDSVLDENGVDIKEKLRIGERLYTPSKFLEEAKQFRAIYTPDGLTT